MAKPTPSYINPNTGQPYGGWGGYNPYAFQGPTPQPTAGQDRPPLQIGPQQGYAEERSGIEPGTEWGQPWGEVTGPIWDKLWGGIEGETRRVHGDDLTIGQSLLGGSTQGSQSRDFLYEPQDIFNQSRYYPYMNALYDAYSQNPESLVAGFDPYQTAGQQLGGQTAGGLQGSVGQTLGAFGQALDPNSAFSSPLYQNALQSTLNPFIRSFQQGIQPTAQRFQEDIGSTLRNFNQNVLPGIRSQAVGVGQTGGSREGIAQGIAGQDLAQTVQGIGRGVQDTYRNLTSGLMDNLGNISSQYAQNAFNQGIQSRNQALGLAPQVGQFSFMPSQYLQDIGATRQGLNQQYRSAPFTLAAQLQALMGEPTILNQTQSTGRSTGSQAQAFNNVMQGIGSMFGGM